MTRLASAVVACVLFMAPAASASPITETFSLTGPDVTGSGSVVFDRSTGTLDPITHFTLSGTAWGSDFEYDGAGSGGASSLPDGVITQWYFDPLTFASIDETEVLVVQTFFINIADGIIFYCIPNAPSGGSPPPSACNFATSTVTEEIVYVTNLGAGNPIPEPGPLVPLATGLVGLGVVRRHVTKKAAA